VQVDIKIKQQMHTTEIAEARWRYSHRIAITRDDGISRWLRPLRPRNVVQDHCIPLNGLCANACVRSHYMEQRHHGIIYYFL
jgi:hypothetical protein